jgi:opacity protein-like surface antigen
MAPMAISANYSSNKIESVNGSFGKGVELGLGAGYNLNKNIAAEINLNYLFGGKIDFSDATDSNTPTETETLKGRMFRIIPTIKVSGGEKFKPYAKIGLVLGVGTKLIDESVSYNYIFNGTIDKIEETTEFDGGISFGFKGNAGIDFSISEKLGIFVEINFISQSWAPQKAEITRYELNGVNKLSSLDVRDKETEFVESYDPNLNIETYESDKSLKIYLPFSSWGFNAGIKLTFGSSENN